MLLNTFWVNYINPMSMMNKNRQINHLLSRLGWKRSFTFEWKYNKCSNKKIVQKKCTFIFIYLKTRDKKNETDEKIYQKVKKILSQFTYRDKKIKADLNIIQFWWSGSINTCRDCKYYTYTQIPHYLFNLWSVSKNPIKHKMNEIYFGYGLINAKNKFDIHKYLIKT